MGSVELRVRPFADFAPEVKHTSLAGAVLLVVTDLAENLQVFFDVVATLNHRAAMVEKTSAHRNIVQLVAFIGSRYRYLLRYVYVFILEVYVGFVNEVVTFLAVNRQHNKCVTLIA